jgi:D-inositol-3-phosphate glycosyltransferase
MGRSDRIVALTAVDRRQMRQHYGSLAPIEVIPGGVDLEHFAPRPQAWARQQIGVAADERVLLFVGRIQRLKGLDILVQALARLEEPRARLLIVGGQADTESESHEIARLQQLVARLGVGERVTFVGPVAHERLPLYYAAADVTVMPSSYESFGLVAVESLACGTPVVATRVGGLTSIVRDGETGFLVPWRDAALFAERIRSLLVQPGLRQQFAGRARGSVEQFGWGRIADEHLLLYRRLIERASTGQVVAAASGS